MEIRRRLKVSIRKKARKGTNSQKEKSEYEIYNKARNKRKYVICNKERKQRSKCRTTNERRICGERLKMKKRITDVNIIDCK